MEEIKKCLLCNLAEPEYVCNPESIFICMNCWDYDTKIKYKEMLKNLIYENLKEDRKDYFLIYNNKENT